MKIAIIGAGPAGLASARHCSAEGFQFDIFEQTGKVGGTWNYSDYTDVDENGLEVHSSIYEGLRTNTPKELMQYEDFSYPPQEASYIDHPQVLKYIKDYAEKFEITPQIKFFKKVVRVDPKESKWHIDIQDVKNQLLEHHEYDAVMVCNGHYRKGCIPQIEGLNDDYSGHYIHSRDYRKPTPYAGKKVLVIGTGPSGSDICRQISTVADKVYISHHPGTSLPPLPSTVVPKQVLKQLKGLNAIFEDGTIEDIDEIVFCTGYLYSFPFFSENCKVEGGTHVRPLYKQIISIEHPTMAFIGLPALVCCFPEFDIQVRFFLSTLSGHFKLPHRTEMWADYHREIENMKDKRLKHFHVLGERQEEYFNVLAETANIKKVAPVINKLYAKVRIDRNLNDCFRIIDSENFLQVR